MMERVAHHEAGVATPELLGRVENAEKLAKTVIFLAFSLIVFSAFVSGAFDRAHYWYNINFVTRFLSIPLLVYSCLMLVHLPYRAILCFLYRPYALSAKLPSITFIIPAYNEGAMVEKAIESSASSDYPRELMEVICVDDGSTDDTWEHIQRAAGKYPGVVQVLRHPRNRGKRHALATAFRQARGEILVTLDSDSVMAPDAARHLVAPFADPKVGATTARVRVYNKSENLLTRMLAVRYVMAFEFFRASTSVFKTVMCCSGVLSAYRAKVVAQFQDAWLNQEFLGQRCTYGDDRALTNFVLRSGYHTVYQRTAEVRTLAPATLPKLARMLTRWHKSFIRESIIFSGFMFTRYRDRYRLPAIFDFLLTSVLIPLQFYITLYSVYHIFVDPILILRFLALIIIMGLTYMLFYIRFERNSDFIYGVLYSFLHVFFLMWTVPYAVLTFKNNSWLTR
jgi:hyaluronan synthase